MIPVTYEIDAEDRLRHVGGSFGSFATANGAPELERAQLVGRSIWDWIAGDDVRHAYRLLFQRVRERQARVRLPFRCDSPELRRFMELYVAPGANRSLLFTAHLLRTEVRPRVTLLDATVPRSETLVALCSWCKRARGPGDHWLEIEEVIPALEIFDRVPPSFSHTICPDCEAALDATWGLARRA